MPAAAAAAIGTAEFAAALTALGPFETAPDLAVAVSGGSDSMALVLLAARWAAATGATITALTVDHGLRPEAGEEARQVARWLAGRGIAHDILTWCPGPLASGLQAAARQARYGLLAEWCRSHDILHLLAAHQRDDQAETVAMRRARSSGLDGLAGMPAVRLLDGVRLLRPLLDFPHARLVATLQAQQQPWLEDPSNQDERFERVRVRRRLAEAPDDDGGDPAATAATQAADREAALTAAAARLVRLSPAGFASFDLAAWRELAADLRVHLLSRLLATIGGGPYPPRGDRLLDLAESLDHDRQAGGRTLAGCRILRDGSAILVLREAGRLPAALPIRPGDTVRWDRYRVRLDAATAPGHYRVAAFGGARAGPDEAPAFGGLPARIRATLPVVWQDERILCVPNLTALPVNGGLQPSCRALFMPLQPFVRAGTKVNAGLRVV